MQTVGVKELKNRLSHYLRLVQKGARFLVTDHGRPVAELGPSGAGRAWLGEAWERAVAEGWITMPRPGPLPSRRPVRLKGGVTLSDAILEDRG